MNLVPAFRPPKSECLAHAPCSNDRNIHDDYLGYLCSTQGFVRSCVGSSVDRRNITAIHPQIRTVDIISQRAGQKRHCIGDIVGPPNTGYRVWHDFLNRAPFDLCPLVRAPALLTRMSRSPSNCSACFVALTAPSSVERSPSATNTCPLLWPISFPTRCAFSSERPWTTTMAPS